jgi:hypothetical protein
MMAEPALKTEIAGWAVVVSLQRIGDIAGDRLFLAPFHVGISDKGAAIKAVKDHIGWSDDHRVEREVPISADAAKASRLSAHPIQIWSI